MSEVAEIRQNPEPVWGARIVRVRMAPHPLLCALKGTLLLHGSLSRNAQDHKEI